MTQQELSNFISPTIVTWETVKLTLLSPDNKFPILQVFSDDSIILDSIIYLNSSFATPVALANNEFVILLSTNYYDPFATTPAFAYDLTNNQANLIGATPGTIFCKSLNQATGTGFSSFTFLLFRIN